MPELAIKNKWSIESTGTYLFLLATIFVTELAITVADLPLSLRRIPVSAALFDTGILIFVFALPLLLLCLRIETKQHVTTPMRLSIFLQVLAAVFVIEFSLLLLLPSILSSVNYLNPVLIDALLTMLFSALPVWWLFHKLEVKNRHIVLADYLNSPPIFYGLLLSMVFLAYLLLEIGLPFIFYDLESTPHLLISSFLTTLLIAPILWLLITRPLQHMAVSEHARCTALYAQVNDAIITFNEQGLIKHINPAAQQIFGYPADLLIGQPAALLLKEGEPQLSGLMQAVTSKADQADHALSYVLPGRRQDGTEVTMEVSISNIQLQGKAEFLLLMRDITERKLAADALADSEDRFRQIFEMTDDAITFLNRRTHSILDLNITMAEMFDYSQDEIRYNGLSLLFPETEFQRIMNTIKRLQPKDKTQLDNLIGLHKDGSEFMLSMRIKALQLQENEIIYLSFRDVTERLQMEAEAREIQAKLIQANKMTSLGLMISGVAHEINNPNNYILSSAQILERTWRDACKVLNEYYQDNGDFLLGGLPYSQLETASQELFHGITDGSRRINKIVSNLKNFARQESVALDDEVDINQVVKSAISILHYEIDRFTEKFHTDFGEKLGRVRGNYHQLGQVVVNLLMNACQALPDRTCPIHIVTCQDSRSTGILIMIQDAGNGIPAEAAARIMEPFFTTKLDSGGTGLGLSICRSIIKDHRGVLDFESKPGVGTTFYVRLPVLENHAEKEL